MELNKYQFMSKRTLPHADYYKNPVAKRDQLFNMLLGMNGEVGEVTEILKKHLCHGHELNIEEVEKELGDVLFYIAGLASTLNIQLDVVAEKNLTKLSKRYPNGFTTEDSIKRVDAQ